MIARARSETGLTLIETVIAVSMLLVAMIGLLSMAALATVYTENHGHLEARTTEYAQDKMEQLLAIAFTDAVTDTTQFPASRHRPPARVSRWEARSIRRRRSTRMSIGSPTTATSKAAALLSRPIGTTNVSGTSATSSRRAPVIRRPPPG
jgi:Tfp pilus assembly protein PilV